MVVHINLLSSILLVVSHLGWAENGAQLCSNFPSSLEPLDLLAGRVQPALQANYTSWRGMQLCYKEVFSPFLQKKSAWSTTSYSNIT